MVISLLSVELYFPENGSLKEKRQYLRSIKDKVRASFNVSVAEVDYHDLWQRSKLAFVCVAVDRASAEEVLKGVVKFLERYYSDFILDVKVDYIKPALA
ncbi:MAG: DUF503 domain-containing protein [Aquificota bacterium]|nr:MAG: DUF503 domain-containing protein [Aquificota bacterium]